MTEVLSGTNRWEEKIPVWMYLLLLWNTHTDLSSN